MGMWGFELYQNDTALDVKDEFEELFNAGKTAQEITDKLTEDYKSIMGDIDGGYAMEFGRAFISC